MAIGLNGEKLEWAYGDSRERYTGHRECHRPLVRLLDKNGFTKEQIEDILLRVDDVCHDCWNHSYSEFKTPCYCQADD